MTFDYSAGLVLNREEGEIVFHKHKDGKIEIIKAEPKILITYEFAYRHKDWVYLTCDKHPWYINCVITFTDDFNHKFIYVIKEQDFLRMVWIAEWPD